MKALIFDMDGTIVDNIPFHKKSFKILLAEHGREFTHELFLKINGRRIDDIMKIVFPDVYEEKRKEYGLKKEHIYRDIYKEHVKPMPGLVKLLESAREKGILCALASSGSEANINFVMEHTALRKYFKIIEKGADVKQSKPNPDIFLEAARKLGLDASECIVFEDAINGVLAAKHAGMKVVGVLTNETPGELHADLHIKDFTEIDIEKLSGI